MLLEMILDDSLSISDNSSREYVYLEVQCKFPPSFNHSRKKNNAVKSKEEIAYFLYKFTKFLLNFKTIDGFSQTH